jgi:hypothetical protein
MRMRIALAAFLTGPAAMALAQGSLPAPPRANAPPAGQTHAPPTVPPSAKGPGQMVVPQAAREGEKGLPTGENANSGDPVIVKRKP